MSKKIYISLPITGRPIEEAFEEAARAADEIREQGDIPLSPFDISPYSQEKDYADYMGDDIRALLRADSVLFLPGWEQSKGCRLEHAAAEIYGIEIKYEEE